MKKFLELRWPAYAVIAGIILAVAFVQPSDAGMILKQNQDGSASWEKNDSVAGKHGADNTYTIGRQVVALRFADLSSAATRYVVMPVSYQVTSVYSTIDAALTVTGAHTAETFAVAIKSSNSSDASGAFDDASTTVDVTISGSAGGDVDSSTGLSIPLDGGEALAVGNAGKVSAGAATVYVVLDPV